MVRGRSGRIRFQGSPSKGDSISGRRMKIDESRRLVLDVLYLAQKVPTCPADKYFDLRKVALQRQAAAVPISWPVLFMKAYSIVAVRMPELRRSYLRWPRPHLYENAQSVASVAVSRRYQRQDRLFWARFHQPDKTSLVDLQRQLTSFCSDPVENVFGRQLTLSRLPTWARRMIWWGRLNLTPRHRARRVGTFGLSVLAEQGIYNRNHPHFLTMSVAYGPTEPDGRTLVTFIGDHRVMDGLAMVRGFKRLERVLCGEICDELATLEAESKVCA